MKCIEDEIPFDLPEGWAWERLSNLAAFSGGKTPSTSRGEYWGEEVLWVTSKDMKSKYITSSQLRLSVLGAEQMQVYQPNTLLLVTRSGILTGAVGQQRIGKEYVEGAYFPIPPIKEQERIVQQINTVFECLNTIADALS